MLNELNRPKMSHYVPQEADPGVPYEPCSNSSVGDFVGFCTVARIQDLYMPISKLDLGSSDHGPYSGASLVWQAADVSGTRVMLQASRSRLATLPLL